MLGGKCHPTVRLKLLEGLPARQQSRCKQHGASLQPGGWSGSFRRSEHAPGIRWWRGSSLPWRAAVMQTSLWLAAATQVPASSATSREPREQGAVLSLCIDVLLIGLQEPASFRLSTVAAMQCVMPGSTVCLPLFLTQRRPSSTEMSSCGEGSRQRPQQQRLDSLMRCGSARWSWLICVLCLLGLGPCRACVLTTHSVARRSRLAAGRWRVQASAAHRRALSARKAEPSQKAAAPTAPAARGGHHGVRVRSAEPGALAQAARPRQPRRGAARGRCW